MRGPVIRVTNAQREAPIDISRMRHVARCVIRRLRIRTSGTLAMTFIGSRRMQALNERFLRHDRPTDVLSFRYEREPIIGEILIAPRQARSYARGRRIPYEQELARYVVHGLLHWLGQEDRTRAQRWKMRVMEDRLLRHAAYSVQRVAYRRPKSAKR